MSFKGARNGDLHKTIGTMFSGKHILTSKQIRYKSNQTEPKTQLWTRKALCCSSYSRRLVFTFSSFRSVSWWHIVLNMLKTWCLPWSGTSRHLHVRPNCYRVKLRKATWPWNNYDVRQDEGPPFSAQLIGFVKYFIFYCSLTTKSRRNVPS